MPELKMRAPLITSFAVAAITLLAAGHAAQARDARCEIAEDNRIVYNRICDFQPDGRDGSFSLSAANRQTALDGEILMGTGSVIEPGLAEVRGLTRAGVNSRWGQARRSRSDPACWAGDGFRVCAR